MTALLPHRELPWEMVTPPEPVWRARTDDGSWLRLHYTRPHGWIDFVIGPAGVRVWVTCSNEGLVEDTAELLLGPVFTSILSQRGLTCLHAGVVQVDDRVIGVVGESGSGKSTTSLALVQRGGSLVSDDVAVLSELDGRPAVAVGAPRLRMKPDAADVLCGSFAALEPLLGQDELQPPKRFLEVPQAGGPEAGGSVALDALYLLGPRLSVDEEPSVRRLSAIEALPRLMDNRHLAHLLERDGHERDFGVLAWVVGAVPVGELLRPEGLHALDRTVDAILGDVLAIA